MKCVIVQPSVKVPPIAASIASIVVQSDAMNTLRSPNRPASRTADNARCTRRVISRSLWVGVRSTRAAVVLVMPSCAADCVPDFAIGHLLGY